MIPPSAEPLRPLLRTRNPRAALAHVPPAPDRVCGLAN